MSFSESAFAGGAAREVRVAVGVCAASMMRAMMKMAEGAGPRRTLESLRLYEQKYAQARR